MGSLEKLKKKAMVEQAQEDNARTERRWYDDESKNVVKDTYGIDHTSKSDYTATRAGYNASRKGKTSRMSRVLNTKNGAK
jgi:hypothetical protein